MTVFLPSQSITGLKISSTQVVTDLHVTGGIRARMVARGQWQWSPILVGGQVKALAPMTIRRISALATSIGGSVLGGDEISGIGTPLLSRIWTPLNGPGDGQLQPADRWNAIAGNARSAGDNRYAALAGHIAISLRAAGIRLRDASDGYHGQLMAALMDKRKPKLRFSNIPLSDLHIAFHSVLSELSSARDYLASILAYRLGAPEKVDALNRFKEWLSAASRSHMHSEPTVAELLRAYDDEATDPWLYHITEYRNLFLHRKPLGDPESSRWLVYDEKVNGDLTIPVIEMPLGEDDPSAPGQDALLRFVELYRKMAGLLATAASVAAYPATLPSFVAV